MDKKNRTEIKPLIHTYKVTQNSMVNFTTIHKTLWDPIYMPHQTLPILTKKQKFSSTL
jgi:hypothetical protein